VNPTTSPSIIRDVHIPLMRKALEQAEEALKVKEVPVGAIITDKNGLILSTSRNEVESRNFAGAHAEVLAIERASKKLGNWRLSGCTLYVTLEPCPMCASLAMLSRVYRIVYGCKDPRLGAVGSLFDLSHHPSLPHQIDTIGGILEDECSSILKKFFLESRDRSNRDNRS